MSLCCRNGELAARAVIKEHRLSAGLESRLKVGAPICGLSRDFRRLSKRSPLVLRWTRPSAFRYPPRVMNRREFVSTAAMAAASAALPRLAQSQDTGLQPIWTQIEKLHDESVQRLQNWIRQPS